MNKNYNYYDVLKTIKQIQFTHEDIWIKCNKVRKVIKLMITSSNTLNFCLTQCKVPKSTFFDIVQQISLGNELNLINKSRAPKVTQNLYSWDTILPRALKMMDHGNRDFALTIRQLTVEINRIFNINLSYSQLSSKLKAYREKVSQVAHKCKIEFSKWEICELGYIQMDGLKVNTTIKNVPKSWHIFTAIDCYSRVLFCKCYDEQTKTNAVKFYMEAKEFFLKLGIQIFHVRTDNGFEWVNCAKKKQFRKVGSFELVLHNDYVEHDTTEAATPHHNGKVERCNKSIKNEFLKHNAKKNIKWTIELINKKLSKYMNNYNKKRIHATLSKTPIEVLQNYLRYGVINEHVFN